jgi:hypothetical protein
LFWTYGQAGCSEVLLTHPNTYLYVTVYVDQVSNVLGRVLLMPLFLLSNATPTIPCELQKYQHNQFSYCSTDTNQESGRRGSNVSELNSWLWQFGRGKLSVGGLPVTQSVADTEDRQFAVLQDGARRGHAMRTKRKHKAAARNARCSRE